MFVAKNFFSYPVTVKCVVFIHDIDIACSKLLSLLAMFIRRLNKAFMKFPISAHFRKYPEKWETQLIQTRLSWIVMLLTKTLISNVSEPAYWTLLVLYHVWFQINMNLGQIFLEIDAYKKGRAFATWDTTAWSNWFYSSAWMKMYIFTKILQFLSCIFLTSWIIAKDISGLSPFLTVSRLELVIVTAGLRGANYAEFFYEVWRLNIVRKMSE